MPLGHMGINVRDLARAKAYFDELMPLRGFEPFIADAGQFSYKPVGDQPWPALFFYPALAEGDHSRDRCGLNHLAFAVADRATVHAVHDRVRQLASDVLYPPQEFPQYHPGYYAVFWLGPEGLTLEAVCHREST
jgi:catechol 2,3-dioxygenase-like lactoylglutathione lyase family enzyme